MEILTSGLLALVTLVGQADTASSSTGLSASLPFNLPVAMAAQAPGKASSTLELSLGVGALFGGEVTLEAGGSETDVDTETGFLGKATLDLFPMDWLGFGGYLSGGTTAIEIPGADVDAALIEIGFSVKGRLNLDLGDYPFLVTPGLGIGYRAILIEDGDDSDGLAVNFGVDFRVRLKPIDVFIEPGFITQPVGGSDDVDVTFGPIPYVLVGIGLRI